MREQSVMLKVLLREKNWQQKSNLRFHLSMLIADKLSDGIVRRPQQLRTLAVQDESLTNDQITEFFDKLSSGQVNT